jgi:hypothetical protein
MAGKRDIKISVEKNDKREGRHLSTPFYSTIPAKHSILSGPDRRLR